MRFRGLLTIIFLLGFCILYAQQADSLFYEANLATLDFPIEEAEPQENSEGLELDFQKIGIVFLLIFFIAIFIVLYANFSELKVRSNVKSKILLEHLGLEDLNVDFMDLNIEELILKARHSGDKKQLLRAHFIGLIQRMARHKYINYEIDKTNGYYLKAIKDDTLKRIFGKEVVRIENVWFGDEPLSLSMQEIDEVYKGYYSLIKQQGTDG